MRQSSFFTTYLVCMLDMFYAFDKLIRRIPICSMII